MTRLIAAWRAVGVELSAVEQSELRTTLIGALAGFGWLAVGAVVAVLHITVSPL